MKNKYLITSVGTALGIFLALPVYSKITLPDCISDNMVLQQQSETPLWGTATAGKRVAVVTSWDSRTYTAVADAHGKWAVNVETPQAGGPYSISISDGKKRVLTNVLIGEVWICSGQSNMAMPLAGWGQVTDYEQEIAAADYPEIRLLHVKETTAAAPRDEAATEHNGWQVCSPATISEFSSVGYFFGRHLNQQLHVPIGLINTSWGGTIAEAWTSGESLAAMPDFKAAVQEVGAPAQLPDDNPNRPTVLYNAMIHPLTPYAVQGAIWYQGESNADRAEQYKILFPLMIRDWRRAWGRDLPFYFVQLANFMERKAEPQESHWAALREAQLQTLQLNNTGMAVAIDIGDEKDIHPKNKQEVGRRLALAAEANTYNKRIAFSGPVYTGYKIENDKIHVYFKHAGTGLATSDGKAPAGFAIAGPDKKFYWATAVVEKDRIVVSSPHVAFPVAVRYAWADNPACNLCNDAQLPASPFRTDSW
ncbi:MAG: sialate O-acetylesterase [Prevotellaceae bacterium]|jgi:sialate O-acetylesterase|nr:sialate O-acetylesterase [Prevotellaceae bacterium]